MNVCGVKEVGSWGEFSSVRLWQLLCTDFCLPSWLMSHIEAGPYHITHVKQSETEFSSELNPESNQVVV